MLEFSGVMGIAKKVLFYKRIDYSNVHQMISDYNTLLSDDVSKHM